ncbi:MAG TPA: CBS domain-containing protein [Vicinamibacterales bacterium]|nr:CBS domain-containing protein [Vicinamibacterales bacterium]
MATCGDVMTREPVYCVPSDTAAHAADLMRAHDIGSLPVVDSGESGRLVGIVTDRDLVVKVVAGTRAVNEATVRDAMTPDPWRCHPEDTVDRAAAVMAERQVRRLPIVDAEGRLVGIIAQADIATRLPADGRTSDLVEAISEPGEGTHT